jgi:hypothetical protein
LLEPGGTFLRRNDDHAWAKALRPSGGLTWRAQAPERITEDNERTKLESIYEELARPLRIDQLDVFSSNDAFDTELAARLPAWIAEGQGVDELFVAASTSSEVRVQGELWAEPLSFSARSSPAREKLWAGLVFGSSVLGELSEAEMMPLALLAGAVSPVTSYLAIEPGVRPSTEGLEPEERLHRVRSPTLRMGGTLAGQGRGLALDREAFLRDQLGPEWRRCGGAPGAATLMLETTLNEIVSVAVQENPPSGDPILVSCMEEAVWSLLLPSGFAEEWAPYAVDV